MQGLLPQAQGGSRLPVTCCSDAPKRAAIVIAPFDAEEDNSEEEHDEDAGKLTFYISNCETCVGSGGATGSGEVIRRRP